MNFRDSSQDGLDTKYLTKQVLINGQFVTLYSSNGQTWVSSPEDIPALMERLENAHISLNVVERTADGEGPKKVVESDKKADDKAGSQKVLQTKYRIKGPKPRPILRQGGVVIEGTPIEPISASNATMSFSSDVVDDTESKLTKSQAKAKGAKGKQASLRQKMIAPVLERPLGAKASLKKAPQLGKSASSKAVKAAVSKAVVMKPAAKPVTKSAAKAPKKAVPVAAKKVAKKAQSKPSSSKKKVVPAKKAVASKKSGKKGRSSKR